MTNQVETVHNCAELIEQYENDLEHTTSDFQMLQHRIEVLTHLINCGIEYTTISKLNQIH